MTQGNRNPGSTHFKFAVDAPLPRFAELIRPNDQIVIGQAGAEPLSLTRALVGEAQHLPPCRLFLGAVLSDTFETELPTHLSLAGYGVMGRSVRAFSGSPGGVEGVLPTPYSGLEAAFGSGRVRADVVLLQLAPSRDGKRLSLGLAHDYVVAAARKARIVIAEINPHAPFTPNTEVAVDFRIDHAVWCSEPPLNAPTLTAGETEQRIAALIAQHVPDRATIQVGIGSLPDAVLGALAGHAGLGLHTGLVADSAIELIEKGVIDNRWKGIDEGVSVSNCAGGTARLRAHLDGNPLFELRPAAYTHSLLTLSQVKRFHAINSALEVDLTGQANAEHDGRGWRGGLGGLGDFARGARLSEGGRSIIALASTTRDGATSRIVLRVQRAQVTLGRGDADWVITEWGAADLRDADLGTRAKRLIDIAHPAHRESLARQWHDFARGG
jgi:acetyl-CoA hydrolase